MSLSWIASERSATTSTPIEVKRKSARRKIPICRSFRMTHATRRNHGAAEVRAGKRPQPNPNAAGFCGKHGMGYCQPLRIHEGGESSVAILPQSGIGFTVTCGGAIDAW
jgi:hypothetical protein